MPLLQTQKNNNDIFNQMAVDQAVILNKVTNLEKKVDSIDEKLDKDYATKEWCTSQFGETTKQVKTIIGLIVTTVILALLGLVIIR
jgi:hypothetical protein